MTTESEVIRPGQDPDVTVPEPVRAETDAGRGGGYMIPTLFGFGGTPHAAREEEAAQSIPLTEPRAVGLPEGVDLR